jgi:hypothetical protein
MNAKSQDVSLSYVKESLLTRLTNNFGITVEEIDLSETLATYSVDSLKSWTYATGSSRL